jgi:predicted alpha/beta superfamily hydrolase
LLAFTLIAINATAQHVQVSAGNVQRFSNFPSQYVTPRNIDVWLPDGYSKNKKYAVIYMHDGQMLFDSTNSWNKQEWHVDETVTELMAAGKMRDCIVVGIWNTPARFSEYLPQKPFEKLSSEQQEIIYEANSNGNQLFPKPVRADEYLKFLVSELKPFIDTIFSVSPDLQNTFIGGSSMGGLISMYAVCEYPQVFGGAACMSTHWMGLFTVADNPLPDAMLSYLSSHLPSPENHLLYFDHGTATLDAMYAPFQQRADSIIRAAGYTTKNFMSRVFDGADHSENSWSERLAIPLLFLLPK